ncbi:hypothetical protein NGC65_00115 [Staphylococcus xylosus]|uniref:hypothetical protein n=1 Tax=Staphylococcus xylosus TaxID=1288 RepID=UPI002DBB39C5|nr:hypothetical protein [Staphylococcus xylosus]MEB7863845.1 hypothetical protein [Staphylococcus xylosus]
MNSKKLFDMYINGYTRETENYNFLADDTENAFPILKFKNYLSYCLFTVPEDIFQEKKYLVIVDNLKELEETLTINKNDLQENQRKIMEKGTRERFETYLRIYYDSLFKKNILKIIPVIFSNYDLLATNGKLDAENDFKKWRKENKNSLDSYDHNKISPYSHLDYEGLIINFDSEKYKNDFKYQMSQAEECYKRKLYLPAASTLSVALETVLMAICQKEGVVIKSKESTDTMMNYLGERLLQENIINYRMHKRIDVTYSLRNSVSHSNPGEVSKADCQIILSCIKVLIDDHYSK